MKSVTPPARRQLGFTLIELCVCAGISAAVLSQAIPGIRQLREQQALKAEAAELAADLRFARSEAARLGTDIAFRLSGRGSNACYVLHTGSNGDCDCAGGQAVCRSANAQILKVRTLPAGQALTISSRVETLTYQHVQGLVTPAASIDISSGSGATVRQVVAITGRTRSCALGQALGSLPRCG